MSAVKLLNKEMKLSRLCPALSAITPSVNKGVWRFINTETICVKEDIPLKSWKEIPGPSSLPFVGPLRHFLPGGSYHNLNGLELTQKLYKNFGPIVKIGGFVGVPPIIFLFDAESSAQILHRENWLPLRPGFKSLEYYRTHHRKHAVPNQPTGLLTDHGDAWKEFRSTVNPVLMQPKTVRLYTTSIDQVAVDMVARLKSLRDKNNQLRSDLNQEMNLWSLESIGVVALGCRLNCLDSNLPEDSYAKKLIQTVHDLFLIVEALDFKPSFWKLYATPTFKKAMKLYEQQELLSKHFIDKAIEDLKNKNQTDEEKGILEKLLEINEEFALIMASDMLFAGVDTTSNTIIATLYLLATNPDKQEKLRTEVLLKQENKYLKACLKESIRMMPVASGNLRVTTKEYNILGYKIPSNMHTVFAHHDMSLMEEHFPRPNEFIPERWLTEKNDPLHYKHAHPFAYSPFGFGVRSCVGRRIAELELETFLARLMENFRVEWFGPPMKVKATSINYVKGPFNFIFKDVGE